MKLVKAKMVMNNTVVFIFVYIIFERIVKYEAIRFLTYRSLYPFLTLNEKNLIFFKF